MIRKTIFLIALMLLTHFSQAQRAKIYHKGWIDCNKNGKLKFFEDPTKPIESRVNDLIQQMNLNEKTCQTATLYGYGRVLKDEMPTAGWKNTTFEFRNLTLSKKEIRAKANLEAKVDVKNTGTRQGDQVGQLYLKGLSECCNYLLISA